MTVRYDPLLIELCKANIGALPPAARDYAEAIVLENKPVSRDWLDFETRPLDGGRITVAAILDLVSLAFSVSLEDLLAHRRTHPLTRYRQVVMYLARELTNQSYPEIARRLNGRDHTTILHGFRTIAKIVAADDSELAKQIKSLRAKLEEGANG